MTREITITPLSKEAAITMIQQVAPVEFRYSEQHNRYSSGKNRTITYISADDKIIYGEVYRNGELKRIEYRTDGNVWVIFEVDASGAESLTADEITEIRNALGLEAEEYVVTSEAQSAAMAEAPATNEPVKEEKEMTTTIITNAELTTKVAVAIDETPTSEKAEDLSYAPCKGFSVNGNTFTSLKRGIEDWLDNVICNGARPQLLIVTRKQLLDHKGEPIRGVYTADRVIVKFNIDSYNDFSGKVKGSNRPIKVAPSEEYLDPEYETRCKKIVTDWLDKNAGEYRKYQLRMEAKRRADKYYTEIPDWNHNCNRVPNSQREAIRKYLEQLHAADETVDEHEPETPEPSTPQINSDATIATLGSLLVTALTALYNVTQGTAPAKIAEEPATQSTCYVVRLYGYNAAFLGDPFYSGMTIKFDNLSDAVKYALDDRRTRRNSKYFGGLIIDKDFDDGNITVMSITRTGEIEAYVPESRQLLEKLASADEDTGAVELKIGGTIAEDSATFTIPQPPLDTEPVDRSIDSETPATKATILLQPTSDKAAMKDLSDTVLDLKKSADEIEELLAGGYGLGDNGHAAIARAQELMKQALAELSKLKSIDFAA